ncbi:MAG TPA: transcription elongation factor GreA [Candidatus Kapabacteria bacterium]|nr:transcription elongation factor GreA [Candidatus Kapabacteria bacterium]
MADQPVYITRERYKEIEKELHEMKSHGRAEIAKMIAEARAHGDLSENSEYDAAKNKQQLHEYKVMQMELMLMNAKILDEKDIATDRVSILSTVVVKNQATKKELTYKLVSQEEADFEQNKISVTSPIGKALLGKNIGDVVEVAVPAGKIKLEVKDIRRS